MPSRRDQIAMSPVEADAYLRSQRRIVLVTNGPGGMPHAVPMNYGVDDQGRILLTSFRKSQKVRNLERDPRATLLVESGATYRELKSLMVWCDAEIITDADRIAELMPLVQAETSLSASINEAMSEQVRASLAKRAVLRCTPFRISSWDHAKLGAFY